MPFLPIPDEDIGHYKAHPYDCPKSFPPEGICVVVTNSAGTKVGLYWHERGYLATIYEETQMTCPFLYRRWVNAERKVRELEENDFVASIWYWHHDDDFSGGRRLDSRYAELRNRFPGSPRQ